MPIDPMRALEGYLRAQTYPAHQVEPEPAPIVEDDACPSPTQKTVPSRSSAAESLRSVLRMPRALARLLPLWLRPSTAGKARRT
ncbi:hypothetical protein AB0I10_28110 [Streptomyces sp. NPDC050636]|uniref:hypothetical protein n=1 Tax=Streptomyces sp. NPDC050636 TaxID=3154510 RepID=UPI00342FF4D6